MVSGAASAPTDAPELKIEVANARSFFGKYSAVTLMGEVFGRNLDGCGEVAGLAQREDCAANEEQPCAYGGDGYCHFAAGLYRTEGRYGLKSLYFHCHPAASGVQARTQRPDEDGPKVAFLYAHPVNKLAGEQAGDGVKDGEETGNHAVMGIIPVELRCYKVLPRQRKHLPVKVVYRRGAE